MNTFAEKSGTKYEKALTCQTRDREALLAFYGFPAEHWITSAPATQSRASSPPSATEPPERRARSRRRRRSSWSSSSVWRLRKHGAA